MLKSNEWTYNTVTDDLDKDIERVEKTYEAYLCNQNDEWEYMKLKQAIYDLSITIKHEVVNGAISSVKAEEMKSYFWGLLL